MNTKKWFLLFVLFAFFNVQAFPQVKDGISKIVIDAGHGGEDPGALGSKCKEKDITLTVALELGKLISENCPDVDVFYTRKTDVFIPLYNRSKIANDKHADLFISIHCNSSDNKSANGVETFVMGLHKTESNLEVARKENAAMLLEKDYKSTYGDFNPNSPDSYVIFSLYSNAYLESSVQLASKVQKNLLKCTHFRDRQVQQAGFWVLHKVAMPSILVELGFVSNKTEEAQLIDPTFQKALAASLCNAFIEYKNQVEGNTASLISVPETKKPNTEEPAAAKPEEKPAVSENTDLKPVDEPETKTEEGVVFNGTDQVKPHIVVVIDEFGDFILQAGKKVETPLHRLSQMGASCGIYLVLSTDRFEYGVITGTIKANFRTRIAFAVMDKRDSRTIIDNEGADSIMLKWDFLYCKNYDLTRIQSGNLSNEEIESFLDETAALYNDDDDIEPYTLPFCKVKDIKNV